MNVKGIKLDVFFRDDAIADLDLYECQALLAKPKQAVLS